MSMQMTSTQARKLLTSEGFQMLERAIAQNGSPFIKGLDAFENIPNTVIVTGSMLYFEQQCVLPLNTILSIEGLNAYKLLLRNRAKEAKAVQTLLSEKLYTQPTPMQQLAAFGLFGALLEEIEAEDDILTPAAALLMQERITQDNSSLFELFQVYIEAEDEHSYGPVLEYILRTLHVSDMKFSVVYHKRALPIFVQMMRTIPKDKLPELRKRFDDWVIANVADYAQFGLVAFSALQIFYHQMLTKTDWPK